MCPLCGKCPEHCQHSREDIIRHHKKVLHELAQRTLQTPKAIDYRLSMSGCQAPKDGRITTKKPSLDEYDDTGSEERS
jgi:hypothetical protein